MREECAQATNDGAKIIYVDESMFTTANRLTHSFSSKGKNVCIDEIQTSVKALAVVAGISAERGLEAFNI